mmetsp:Transcript_120775/g.385617  ORF Transcript_120775/g.385617 Transcript_120775/m.385617 type:complete len:96 (+) Transcript_120775:34-321(+)
MVRSCMGRRAQRVGGRPGVHREVPAGAGGLEAEEIGVEEYLRYTKEEQKRQGDATSTAGASRVQSEGWHLRGAHHELILREGPEWQESRTAVRVC